MNKEKETEISRRSFFKKSVYSAPILIALGQLTKPMQLHADGTGGPPGPPGGFLSTSSNKRVRAVRPTRSK